MQRLSHRATVRPNIPAGTYALQSKLTSMAAIGALSQGTFGIADSMTALAWWFMLLPALFIVLSAVIFVKYRGWRSFLLIRDVENGLSSPFTERDFIATQYEAYKKHREKIEEIIRLRGHVDASERRHDNVLRDLIATMQFDVAKAYLSAMIAHCKEAGDIDAEITYMTYLDKVNENELEPQADDGSTAGRE